MTGAVNGPDRWTLAGEYVLGTLRGARRRAFRTALERDAGLPPVVSWWEDRLLGLNAAVSPVEPDPETWFRIVQAIGEPAVAEAPPVRRRPAGARLWNSLALWRGLTFAAVAAMLAAVLAALLAQPRPALIAVLQAPD